LAFGVAAILPFAPSRGKVQSEENAIVQAAGAAVAGDNVVKGGFQIALLPNFIDSELTGGAPRGGMAAAIGVAARRADGQDVIVNDVTRVLNRVQRGDPTAGEELLPLVYKELRTLAAARMAHERGTQTLQPTALVHEAWLRLVSEGERSWQSRAQFFVAAAEAMRRILVDRARRKQAVKRGAGAQHIDLDRVDVATEADAETLVRVNDALEKLAVQDPQAAQLVRLRFFIGLDYVEAAEALGISERTAKRCWSFARAWLYRELSRP
jgi:RNA polymerase sigma factor (TIGR02999 family)